MVAILIRRICNDIEMKRNDKNLNDYPEEASMPRQDDVQMRRRSPQQPPVEDESRDHAASPLAAAAAPAATVNVNMSPITYTKSPQPVSAFEQRDDHRSAFSSVQPDDEIVPAANQDHHQQQQQQPTSSSPPISPMPRPVRSGEDPLPFQSPIRYYHNQEQQQPPTESEAEVNAPAAEVNAPAAYPPYQYQGYPPYQQDYYSNYYHQPNNMDASGMNNSQYHQHHPPYQSYHPQEYSNYPQEYNHSHYSYYPPATGNSQHPEYSLQYPQAHHQHQYYPGATHSPMPAPNTLKETPSAVTESTKGTTPSSMPRGTSSTGGEGLDLSPSNSVEDDRKPSASSDNQGDHVKGKKGLSPQGRRHQDYEPIPLHQISAVPVLSSSTASMPPPSPPPYAAAAHGNAFPHAFPQDSARIQFMAPPPPHAVATSRSSRTAHISPPRSTPVSRRRQQRTIAPSSSGSNASSTGGGEGSWERRYNELIEFKTTHGHCEVPQNYAQNSSLGTWVNKQRMEQKNRIEGKNSSLNDSRLERLQSIGFRWAKRKGQASWDEKFNELLAYKAKYGNCHVPTKYKDNTALGRWVSTQRAEYKKYQERQARTAMNADKIRRLESIGFAWFMAL
ncbi:hypothetical protein ACHAXR_003939 [Thalassiosira sp. AJA248-18]